MLNRSKAPHVYLIGGAPRTGKSTLARQLTQHWTTQFTSTDAIRTQLRQTITSSAEPDLYYLDSLNADETNMARLMRDHTKDIIAAAERESAVVWQTVEPFIRSNVSAGRSILVEGVAILPHLVAALNINYSVIYLGNQSAGHAKVILEYAQNHPETWLGSLKPATVVAYAIFCQATSAHIEHEAKKYKQTYIEMSTGSFNQGLDLAVKVLHANKNH
jgi:predicted ATPase